MGEWGGCKLRPSCPPDCSITKFLNRILGLEVHKQNALFQYFSDTFDHLIEVDKKEGKYDMGILGECPQGRRRGLKELTSSTPLTRPSPSTPRAEGSLTNKALFINSAEDVDPYLTVPRTAMQRGTPRGTLSGHTWCE